MRKNHSLSNMIEDLRILMLEPPWLDFTRLVRVVDSVAESPELERLTNDELRAFKGFRITLHRAAAMEADMMVKHVYAHWIGQNGMVAQAIRKLPIASEAFGAFERLTMGPYVSASEPGVIL
jgi:hypothetical protein